MNEDSIKILIDRFWASKIIKFDVDLRRRKISVFISTIENKTEIMHNLVFGDVEAFYYVNPKKTNQISIIPWKNIELSEIHYFKKGDDLINHIRNKKISTKLSANPNFLLEIWSDVLFIEAGRITIDGKQYEL